MFKKKPVIKVLGVKNEVRKVKTNNYTSYGHSLGSFEKKDVEKEKYVTVVLFSKNGELGTREFNGKWNIDDIKTWEEL